jgi:class 3 adenylate cyclase
MGQAQGESQAMGGRFPSALAALKTAGGLPLGEEECLRRQLMVFAAGLMSFGVMAWLAIYWAVGVDFSATVPLAYQLALVVSLAYFLMSGNFAVFRLVLLSLFLFFPFLMQWSIGNFVNSSGVMLWALLAPVGALVVQGPRESIPWFTAYGAMTALSGFFDYYLAAPGQASLPMQAIAVFFALNFAGVSCMVYALLAYFVAANARIRARLAEQHRLLEEEQRKSERLLNNILPAPIARRLKGGESVIADSHGDVIVMFADLVNFTRLTQELPPERLVALLDKVFSMFDALVQSHGLDKIKTVGDAYMVAGGLAPENLRPHRAVAELALAMRALIGAHPELRAHGLNIHVGIASGPAMAGVIGTRRIVYDLWGDTVNTASRLTAEAPAGCIQVDAATHLRLAGEYTFEGPVEILVKGKGRMAVYRLLGRKAPGRRGLATEPASIASG